MDACCLSSSQLYFTPPVKGFRKICISQYILKIGHKKVRQFENIQCKVKKVKMLWNESFFMYSSYVALFYIERDCLSKTEIGEREIYMHSKCM
jgi:hypothetical protein